MYSEYTFGFRCKQSVFWWGTDVLNTYEESTKTQSVPEWYRCGKCRAMDKNLECLYCHRLKAIKYYGLLVMRYSATNAVTQRV